MRAQTLSAATVRAIARSLSQPLAAKPSPRRTIREKLSMTSKPSPCGRATNNRQLLVPRSRAASAGKRASPLIDGVVVVIGLNLRGATARGQGVPRALAELEALGLRVVCTSTRTEVVANSRVAVVRRAPVGSRVRASARHGVIPVARLGAGRAALVAGIVTLGACSSSNPELPPPPCPPALLLDGAERTSAYRAGAGATASPNNLRYVAALRELTSTCRYYEDANGQGVDVDVSFKVIAERGPALLDREEVTYFVATVGPDGRILTRDALGGDLPFEEDE
jgi:hypothetical protein